MVGSGDRSEKIRTYNFPQNRVTDHRIGLTLHQLDLVMEGLLTPLIDAVVDHFQRRNSKAQANCANAPNNPPGAGPGRQLLEDGAHRRTAADRRGSPVPRAPARQSFLYAHGERS